MIKNIINIGIPSKGRLRADILEIFKKNKLNLISERGERDLLGSIKNLKNVKVLYLHAREIVERLGDGSLDLGFSGFDLLKESEVNIQKKISVVKNYGFGKATLVVAIPDPWIDVQTVDDLEIIIQASDFNISPSFNILKLLALKVSPVEVISVMISADPVKG